MLVAPSPQKSTTVRKIRPPFWLRAAFGLGSWIAPRAAIARAMDIFCAPSAEARRRALAADDAGAESSTMETGGHRLHVYRWGEPFRRPYVLIAHGWSDFGLRLMPLVEAFRRDGYAVVTFDQPGHGRSSGSTATLPIFAKCLRLVADRYGPAAGVIGHSMGGAAAAIALHDGLAADRAVLISPPADLAAAADRFAAFIGLAERLHARFRRALERRASVRLDELEAHRNVPAIARPALVIHDLDDREVPWTEGERYARFWPDARLVSTTGLGHNRILADAGVIDSALRFLRGESIGERVVSTQDLPYGFA